MPTVTSAACVLVVQVAHFLDVCSRKVPALRVSSGIGIQLV